MEDTEEEQQQQFCLRWNNFQSNITSEFEALRLEEDFADVTIACEGRQLRAHKVVLSACSPYFKQLFKNNPCQHPILFMTDVKLTHVIGLLEFMYGGEVNVSKCHLTEFLRTAESLKIRGLTDTENVTNNSIPSQTLNSSSSTITSIQEDITPADINIIKQTNPIDTDPLTDNASLSNYHCQTQPKLELPDYSSDDDRDVAPVNYYTGHGKSRRKNNQHESWLPYDANEHLLSTLNKFHNGSNHATNRLIKLAEGVEIYEDQLRSVKWNDYRKLTRGLATILFSPAELATCSVTGQRWSRAGSNERPVKPALDRNKVQAIISYVHDRFPTVEISSIKQVLAYKCKENSTAFKMKAVRFYGEQHENI